MCLYVSYMCLIILYVHISYGFTLIHCCLNGSSMKFMEYIGILKQTILVPSCCPSAQLKPTSCSRACESQGLPLVDIGRNPMVPRWTGTGEEIHNRPYLRILGSFFWNESCPRSQFVWFEQELNNCSFNTIQKTRLHNSCWRPALIVSWGSKLAANCISIWTGKSHKINIRKCDSMLWSCLPFCLQALFSMLGSTSTLHCYMLAPSRTPELHVFKSKSEPAFKIRALFSFLCACNLLSDERLSSPRTSGPGPLQLQWRSQSVNSQESANLCQTRAASSQGFPPKKKFLVSQESTFQAWLKSFLLAVLP